MRPYLYPNMTLSVAMASLILTVSCKRGVVVREQGYIVGATNDIEVFNPSSSKEEFKETFKSTVLISTLLITKKRKFCSGSIINADPGGAPEGIRVLTNFHCFAATTDAGKVSKDFLPEACTSTQIFFNVSGSTYSDAIARKCKEGSLMGDHEGDVATLELDSELPDGYGPLKLWPDADVPADRDAFMIHHPDIPENFVPVGNTGISLPAASITSRDCKTLGEFSTEEWVLDTTLPFSFKHSCDLEHGSSGSALVDVKTNTILGINWGGIEIKYKNEATTVNAATHSSYIQAFLDGDVKRLKEESTKEAKDADALRSKQSKDKKDYLDKMGKCGVVGEKSAPWPNLLFVLAPLMLAWLPAMMKKRKN